MEEALIEMYLAGAPVPPGGGYHRSAVGQQASCLPPSASLNKKAYVHIEDYWRNRLPCRADGIHTSTWTAFNAPQLGAGEYAENVAVLGVAIAVNEDGFS